MKKIVLIVGILALVGFGATSCSGAKDRVAVSEEEKMAFKEKEGDTIEIADADSNYEIIIIEPGFYTWLQSVARPEGYYSQSYLENRNQIYVTNWNQRVLEPLRYDPMLYQMMINYDPFTDYGYEVNYKLFNYFIYFQRKYNQRLGPFLPRI